MKNYLPLIDMVVTILLAVVIAWLGGLTRTYNAFGGEDVLALIMIGWAVRDYVVAKRKEKEA